MKEYIIEISEDSEQVITAPKKVLSKKKKNPSKGKTDHTYLFNKWKDFDIDAKTLREQSW